MHAAEVKEMQRVLNEPKLKRAAETHWLGNTPNNEIIAVLLACEAIFGDTVHSRWLSRAFCPIKR